MTGAPALRKASASARTFSTTFCLRAWAGAPDWANAPPSAITSFCRSWMISAVFRAASFRSAMTPPSAHAHIGDAVAAHLQLHAIDRGRAGAIELVPVAPAPVQVAGVLGHADHAEMPAGRREHPDAARPGDVDVAALVALHPVDQAGGELAGADPPREQPALAERAVAADREDADMGARRIVDVEQRLVGREA